MNKSSIVHIHTDVKFIHNVNGFDNQQFANTIIIIGSKGKYEGAYKESVKYYSFTRINLQKIIKVCATANMVVIYDLNFAKAYIVNRLPKSVIVVWRFFGLELYSKIPEYVYTKRTLKILEPQKEPNFYTGLKFGLKKQIAFLRYRAIRAKEYNKAIFDRTDFFLGLSQPEHHFLKTIWSDLPSFLQLNLTPYLKQNTAPRKKSNLVILGNNRSAYNNHLDIIDRLKETECKSKFEFLMMFNYGFENTYTHTVRKVASTVNEIKILEEFFTVEEFKKLYATADAFVMNGHRQMAMGSLMEALQQNVKIYLSEKNLIYSWLKENGLIVFTIEHFFSDLASNNLVLSLNDILTNQQRLVEITSKFDKHSFQKSISEIIKERSI